MTRRASTLFSGFCCGHALQSTCKVSFPNTLIRIIYLLPFIISFRMVTATTNICQMKKETLPKILNSMNASTPPHKVLILVWENYQFQGLTKLLDGKLQNLSITAKHYNELGHLGCFCLFCHLIML